MTHASAIIDDPRADPGIFPSNIFAANNVTFVRVRSIERLPSARIVACKFRGFFAPYLSRRYCYEAKSRARPTAIDALPSRVFSGATGDAGVPSGILRLLAVSLRTIIRFTEREMLS